MAENAITNYDAYTTDEFSYSKRTVLVIEDNALNREILCELLSNNYNVLQAENGKIGLDLLRANALRVAVVLLDIQMPVMNGYEFLEAQQADPSLNGIPVIVTTGSEDPDEEERCFSLGAADFITKPYNATSVLCRVNSIIRLREASCALQAVEHERLTGLLTKQAFTHHAQSILDVEANSTFDMFYVYIANFAYVNEQYGSAKGDSIITAMANVLRSSLPSRSLLGHLGADKFTFMIPSSTADREHLISSISNRIESILPSANLRVKFGVFKDFRSEISAMLAIDYATYAANSIKGMYTETTACFDEHLLENLRRKRWMEQHMQEALDNGDFKVFYQPKHETATGKLVGAEALVRWISADEGFISPGEFIPLLEDNGFVSHVDYYVWKHALETLHAWQQEGIPIVPVSINASRRDFNDDELLEKRLAVVNENGLDPSFVHLEVTESLFLNNNKEMASKLNAFRDAGIIIELDDFGAGYSSLDSLSLMPFDIMKLDMSLMRNIANPNKAKVLAACISLAKGLGLKTVSEGVETEEQIQIIQRLGGDYIQGYYYSKPLPEDEFRAYLIEHL